MPNKPNYYGLIMAGGRGTRFWPRSRRAHAKQVLPFFGERTLIQQTVDRLKPVLPPEVRGFMGVCGTGARATAVVT